MSNFNQMSEEKAIQKSIDESKEVNKINYDEYLLKLISLEQNKLKTKINYCSIKILNFNLKVNKIKKKMPRHWKKNELHNFETRIMEVKNNLIDKYNKNNKIVMFFKKLHLTKIVEEHKKVKKNSKKYNKNKKKRLKRKAKKMLKRKC